MLENSNKNDPIVFYVVVWLDIFVYLDFVELFALYVYIYTGHVNIVIMK